MTTKLEENMKLSADPRVVPTPANIGVFGIHDKGSEADIYEKTGVKHTAWTLVKTIVSGAGAGLDDENNLRREQFLGGLEEQAQILVDHSVNHAFVKMQNKELIFQANKATNTAGNFNGGGTGNKPICSIFGYEDLPLAQLPVIKCETEIRTKATGTDADETQLGVSFNILVDLLGDGSIVKVITATNTLGGAFDKYGNTGAKASKTDFDINNDTFHVVGNLPNYTGALPWTSNAISINTLLNGDGDVEYTGSYPDAKIVSVVSSDGGHPSGVKLAGLSAQVGDSGTALKAVTAMSELTIGDKRIV